MKYPDRVIATIVAGKEAKKLMDAIRNGKGLSNAAARKTIDRILNRRKKNKTNGLNNK